MRRVVLSVLSMSVAAILLAQPSLATKSTVYVTDRVDDLSHWTQPTLSIPYEGNNIMGEADYLDVTAGWMTLRNEKLTAGMEMVAPVYVEDGLPHGVKRIWYTWYFYIETGPGIFFADYGLHVSWDGETFYAFVTGRDAETPDHPNHLIAYLQNFRVHDNVVEVDLDAILLPDVTAWFLEVIVLMIIPEDDDYLDPARWWWYCIDGLEWDPDESDLPWQPMPS